MERTDKYLEHALPSDEDAEQACLGSILLNNEVIDTCLKYFGPEDLYSPLNRTIFTAMAGLRQENKPIDVITIMGYFKTMPGRPDESIQVTTIANLTFGVPLVTDIETYAKTIRKHSISRQALRLATAVQRDILAGDVDPAEVISHLEQSAMRLSNQLDTERKEGPTGFTEVRDLSGEIKAQFERYHRGEATGVSTGMAKLDKMLDGGGLQRKATYVIGGREKSGKTSLALGWVHDISVKQGYRSLVVTLEMSKESMLKRLFSQHTGIPHYHFRPGFYDTPLDNTYTRAMTEIDEFCKYPISISDNLFSMEAIYRHCAKAVEQGHKSDKEKVGLIVIDYLQLVGLDDSRLTDTARVTRVSRLMKVLASDLDVPVVIMSNLNREGLNEEGREPDVANLRDSGSIAFDAEAVMFVHNPSYIPGKPYEQKEITDYTLIISRQRNGPSGRIPLKLIGPYMSFVTEDEYAKATQQNGTGLPLAKGQQPDIESLWEVEEAKATTDPASWDFESDSWDDE